MYDIYFFKPEFNGGGDLCIKLLVWLITVVIITRGIRLLLDYKRPSTIKDQEGTTYPMVRDLFLDITGMECLIISMILFAIYLGVWTYLIPVFSTIAKNADQWETWISILPQILTFLGLTILFFVRRHQFVKPIKQAI